MKGYNKFLNILLIIFIIILLGVAGYYFYLLYDNYQSNKIANELITEFSEATAEIETNDAENEVIDEPIDTEENEEPNTETPPNTSPTQGRSNTAVAQNHNPGTYYGGYKVIGIIEIPSLNVKYPIFDVDNTKTLSLGTAAIYPMNVEQALNKHGNVVIAGHNYRNSRMFSKIHTLKNDDLIYITDIYGKKVAYKVYNNYTADVTDFNYATRYVDEGFAEISLSTCTNNVNTRTVIWAKAEI